MFVRAVWLATLMMGLVLASFGLPQHSHAHGAYDPEPWQTRVLHDYNDDWGGHHPRNNGHDLIALDLYERWDDDLSDTVTAFRLIMNFGFLTPADHGKMRLHDDIELLVDGAPLRVTLETMDNAVFSSSHGITDGPHPYLTPEGVQDEGRFFVDVVLPWHEMGWAVGTVLSNLSVQAHADDHPMDHMGLDDPAADPSHDPRAYTRDRIALAGPVGFFDVALTESDPGASATDASRSGASASDASTSDASPSDAPPAWEGTLGIQNLLSEPQELVIAGAAGDGWEVLLAGPDGTGVYLVHLGALGHLEVPVYVFVATESAEDEANTTADVASMPAQGKLIIGVVSDLGGRIVVEQSFESVAEAPVQDPGPIRGDPEVGATSDARDVAAPGPGAAAALLLLAGWVSAGPRRRVSRPSTSAQEAERHR